MMKWLWLAVFAMLAIASARADDLPKPTDAETYRSYDKKQIRLGQFLFYDRVLSGSYSVSCATCHNHDRASANGYRLDGQAEKTFDELATNGENPWAPFAPSSRHAPTLFNLGAYEFKTLFSDGRVMLDDDGTVISPAKDDLPNGVKSVLAAQSLLPAVTRDELTDVGKPSAHQGNQAIWDALVARVVDQDGYIPLFVDAFDDVNEKRDIDISYVANALEAFVGSEWRSDASPFDAYLRGDVNALSVAAKRGMKTFYGEAKCGSCHSGVFQTDHQFHAIGMTNIAHKPLAEQGIKPRWKGRYNATAKLGDWMSVRTPSLRNIAKTAPYGMAGQYITLREAVFAHGSDVAISLPSETVDDLIAFLKSLTDPLALKGRLGKPDHVPSYLARD